MEEIYKKKIRIVLGIYLSGQSWASYETLNLFKREEIEIKRNEFFQISKKITNAIMKIGTEVEKEVSKNLFQYNHLAVCVDGSWASTRNSPQGTFTVEFWNTGEIIFQSILEKDRINYETGEIIAQGNHQETSNSMEIKGFMEFIEFMKRQGLLDRLKYIICDKDGKIQRYIKSKKELKQTIVLHDPGHFVKGITNRLIKIFGKGKFYASFPGRIKRWMLFCIKKAEEEVKKKYNITNSRSIELLDKRNEILGGFRRRWKFTLNHYINKECPINCPCWENFNQTSIPSIGCQLNDLQILPDILVIIFNYCYHSEVDIDVLKLVCKQFYMTSYHEDFIYWRKMKIKEKKKYLSGSSDKNLNEKLGNF